MRPVGSKLFGSGFAADLLTGGLHALAGAALGLVLGDPGHQLLSAGLPPLPELAADEVRVTDGFLQLDRLEDIIVVVFVKLKLKTRSFLLISQQKPKKSWQNFAT